MPRINNGTTALILGTVTANGALSIRGGNGITDNGVITVTGTSLFHSDVTAKAITLDSNNAMAGAVSITHTGAADVAIDNHTTALILGTVTTGRNFEARSGNGITDTAGVITVAGTGTFISDVDDKDIVLDSDHAITGALTFTTQGSSNLSDITFDNGSTAISLAAFTTEGDLTLKTDAAIALSGHTVNGDLSVTSAGAISQSAALTVTGTSSFTSTGSNNNITLSTDSNDLRGVVSASTVGSSGDITIDNGTRALILGTVTANGALSIRGGNGITDNGVITVTGTSLFHSDVTAKAITLDSNNAMAGAVSITHTGAADVAIDNHTTALILGTVTTGRNFEARSGNGITDNGVITVAGTSLFHSDVTAKAITLDSNNAMAGAVSITHTGAADVAIDNHTTALILGTVTTGRNFEARSGNGITDNGVDYGSWDRNVYF